MAGGISSSSTIKQYAATSPDTEQCTLDILERENLMLGKDGILVAGGREHHENNSDDTNKHVVRVAAGDALVFYNYDTTKTIDCPKIDWRAIHAALPASEQKCIATHWFHGGKSLTGISNQ